MAKIYGIQADLNIKKRRTDKIGCNGRELLTRHGCSCKKKERIKRGTHIENPTSRKIFGDFSYDRDSLKTLKPILLVDFVLCLSGPRRS